MKFFYTTKTWSDYWKNRKDDFEKIHLSTANHPHRALIVNMLSQLNWLSLVEIGCGGGANLINIVKAFPNTQAGGIDVNPEAIALVEKIFRGGMFKVNSADDIMMSDKSTDVVLSDMTLIYVGRPEIREYIREIKRIARKYIVLCEFHSDSWWNRFALKFNTGYNAYDYRKLLRQQGFYDIYIYKLKPEEWPKIDGTPGHELHKVFTHLIVAKVPSR